MNNDSLESVAIIKNYKAFFDKKIRSLSFREVIFLRKHFEEGLDSPFNDMVNTSQADLKESLIERLSKSKDFMTLTESALSDMTANLIPQDKFKWLVNDIRAQAFLLGNMTKNEGLVTRLSGFSNDLMPEIYKFFDGQPFHDRTISVEEKLRILNKTYSLWQRILEFDNYSKWLNVGDESKIAWTRDYLRTKRVLIKHRGINSLDNKKVRDILLASIDMIEINTNLDLSLSSRDIRNSHEVSYLKKLFIDKMKRAWSQQKYRDAGKTKKPYHLPLTKKTKSRLEKMAEVQGLSETDMLNSLINHFYELKYLDADGKDLY